MTDLQLIIMIYLLANTLLTLIAIGLNDFENSPAYLKLNSLKHPKTAKATASLLCLLVLLPVLLYQILYETFKR